MKIVNIKQNNPSKIWEWIKYRLTLNGYTFGKLALIHKVKKTNFTNVKMVPSPKYERLIAGYIGAAPWELWPDRYDSGRNPNRVSSRYQGHKTFLKQAS
jgi:lambda repressor-like predicted transcriptional regulator